MEYRYQELFEFLLNKLIVGFPEMVSIYNLGNKDYLHYDSFQAYGSKYDDVLELEYLENKFSVISK